MAARSVVGKRPFDIQGQGLQKTKDTAASAAAGACGASAQPEMTSVELGEEGEHTVLSKVVSINKALVQQIDALRLRLAVDSKQHEATRKALKDNTDSQVKVKDDEISKLKTDLQKKKVAVTTLTEQNEKKSDEILALQKHIEELRRDVREAKKHAEELHSDIGFLQTSKAELESGSAYRRKEEEITTLKTEVVDMQGNLRVLEQELAKAKDIIAQQSSRLRSVDNEKKFMQVKFKDELAKVSAAMRLEVEKMRDIMTSQWEEMRELRLQNEEMRKDVKEIRELLVGDMAASESQQQLRTNALKPSLPVLSKDTKRILPGKKKPLT